jgi:hypothetical protein
MPQPNRDGAFTVARLAGIDRRCDRMLALLAA